MTSEREYRNKPAYQGNANPAMPGHAPRPKSEYLDKIAGMEDKELYEETKDKIWFSAWANNNPRSDWHWQCDACYDEWQYRGKGDQYQRAWEYVAKDAV